MAGGTQPLSFAVLELDGSTSTVYVTDPVGGPPLSLAERRRRLTEALAHWRQTPGCEGLVHTYTQVLAGLDKHLARPGS